tara:strand:- start:364 stop:1692 length:1329 start_codon:yes stop_codon:yes gene_type:complete
MSIIIISGDPPVEPYQEPEVLEFEVESYEKLDVKVATQTPLALSQVGDMVATIYKGNLVLQNTYNEVIWAEEITGMDYVVGVDYDYNSEYIILYGSYKNEFGVVWVYTTEGEKYAYVQDEVGVITSAVVFNEYLIYGTDSSFNTSVNSHIVFTVVNEEEIIYDSKNDIEVNTIEIDGKGGWSTIDISENGVYVAAAFSDPEDKNLGTTALFRLQDGQPELCWAPYPIHGSITEIALSSDGMKMAAGTAEGTVMFWHQAPYQITPQWEAQFAEGSEISDIDLSADGTELVAAGGQGDNESIGYWGYWETDTFEETEVIEETYHEPTWTKRMESGYILTISLYENENVFYTRNIDNNIRGYFTVDQSQFYNTNWDYIRNAEWNEWKETHLAEAEDSAENDNKGETVWTNPNTYYPLIVVGLIIFAGYKGGQISRRWMEERNANT